MSNKHTLPNFVHFGTPKSGSGTLSYLLTRHPQVYTPRPKELNYFNSSNQYEKGLDWYEESYFADYAGEPVICDKSIGYSAGNPEQTIERMVKDLGRDFRILLTVRHPVDRAYSQYCMARYKGQIEPLGFTEAVRSALEVDRQFSADDLHKAIDEQGYYSDVRDMAIFRNAMYVVPGEYARLLDLCQSAVGVDNVKILFTEDMSSNLPGTLLDLTNFLGIDPIAVDPGFRRNEATMLRYPWLRRAYNRIYAFAPVRNAYKTLGVSARKNLRKKLMSWNYRPNDGVPAAEPEGQRLLGQHYAADLAAFQQATGRDLSHWMDRHTDAQTR